MDHWRPCIGATIPILPLNGRSIQNLVMLQPGMAQDTGVWLAVSTMDQQWQRGETEVATLMGPMLPIQKWGRCSSGTLT